MMLHDLNDNFDHFFPSKWKKFESLHYFTSFLKKHQHLQEHENVLAIFSKKILALWLFSSILSFDIPLSLFWGILLWIILDKKWAEESVTRNTEDLTIYKNVLSFCFRLIWWWLTVFDSFSFFHDTQMIYLNEELVSMMIHDFWPNHLLSL